MSAQYPGAAGTDANLFVAVNNLSTSLSDNPLSSGATTVNVASTTGFPTAGYITIEAEAISYTGVTGTSFTGCTRGADGTTAASHVTGLTVFHDAVAAHHNVLKDEVKAIETDLVAGMAALTPVTAASTAGSILIRLEHIISQIKNGFGLTNWYDAIATAALLKGGGTMSGAIAMGASKITGLALATASGDAMPFNQVNAFPSGIIIGGNTTSDSNLGTIASVTNSKFYQGSFTATLTGPYSSTWTFYYTLVGRVVTMTVGANTGTSSSGVRFNVGAGAVPSGLRPSSTVAQPIGPVVTGASDLPGPGMIVIGTGGDISIYSKMDSSTWSGSGTNGLDGNSTFSYTLGI